MARARALRIGIVVECGPGGLEDVLCRRICDLLRERTGVEFEVDIVTMSNKARLIEGCGGTTRNLFDRGCTRVVILWDEKPAWPKLGEPLCWHHDRESILANLHRERVTNRPVHLVCIEREFESWLLFDHQMLSKVLSTSAHPARVSPQRNPHRMPNPKATMTSLFSRHRGWRYVDVQHARDFARCLQNLNSLRRCATFRRFAERVIGQVF